MMLPCSPTIAALGQTPPVMNSLLLRPLWALSKSRENVDNMRPEWYDAKALSPSNLEALIGCKLPLSSSAG